MVKLIWTDLAIDDLDDIGNYIAESSERYAKLTVKRLYERVDILKEFPKAGRVVPEKNEESLRELIDGNYKNNLRDHYCRFDLIFYQFTTALEILKDDLLKLRILQNTYL